MYGVAEYFPVASRSPCKASPVLYPLPHLHDRLPLLLTAAPTENGCAGGGGKEAPRPSASMVNGHCAAPLLADNDRCVANIERRQRALIDRIKLLKAKLEGGGRGPVKEKQPAAAKKGDEKKGKEKTAKGDRGAGAESSRQMQQAGTAAASGLVLLAPMPAPSFAPSSGQTVVACAPPVLLDFDVGEAAIKDLLTTVKKSTLDMALSVGAEDVQWLWPLLHVMARRRSSAVAIRSFAHSTSNVVVPPLPFPPTHDSAPVVITVVVMANGDAKGPRVSVGDRSAIFGMTAMCKLLGRLAGLYPMESRQLVTALTNIDFWLDKAIALARAADSAERALIEREVSSALGRSDFLGAADGLSLADVVFFGLLSSSSKEIRRNYASNLEAWMDRCRHVGLVSAHH